MPPVRAKLADLRAASPGLPQASGFELPVQALQPEGAAEGRGEAQGQGQGQGQRGRPRGRQGAVEPVDQAARRALSSAAPGFHQRAERHEELSLAPGKCQELH